MPYSTLICDLKNSRNLINREEIQYRIIDMLKLANDKFKDIIVSPFLITLGDEWQGLLTYPCDYIEIIDFFFNYLNDIDFYCGIGIGDVSIHNFELTVNQLDGPSFHRAREAVTYAKTNNLPVVILFDDWK